jgi:hypothetical protein
MPAAGCGTAYRGDLLLFGLTRSAFYPAYIESRQAHSAPDVKQQFAAARRGAGHAPGIDPVHRCRGSQSACSLIRRD